MAKNPERRFQTATEVASLLERWLAHTQQPETVSQPELISSNERPSIQQRGILAQAWNQWWSERDRSITISVQTMLVLTYLACMICFVSFGLSTGHDSDGRVTFNYRLGVPDPWFKFEVYPEPLVPFRTGLYLWSSSVLLGVIGCLVFYIYWQIEKARVPKTSKWGGPAFMLGIWGAGAVFAVGLGNWM